MNLITPAAWCAALFAAATLFSHTVALRLILLFAGSALVAAAWLRARSRGAQTGVVFVPPLLLPFVLWGAWAALSLFWTLDPKITLKELQNEIGYALLACWMCFVAAQSPHAPKILAAVLAPCAAVVSALALRYEWLPATDDIAWLAGGPGAFSSTLLILVPSTLGFAWFAASRRWRLACLASLVLALPLYAAAGYATHNRILWIGVATQVALLALLLLLRPAQAAAHRRGKLLIAIAAMLLIAGAGITLLKVQASRSAATEGASDARPALWQAVLRRVEERPVTGHGFGRGMARHELRDESGNRALWHSHNLFLDTAFQLGWPGLALLLLLFGWTAGLAWRLARSASDIAFACGLALLPLVAGTMIRNMTDVLWVRQSALLYWAAVGILLGFGLRAAKSAR